MIEVIDNFLSEQEINQLYETLWFTDWYLKGTDGPLIDKKNRGWSLTKYFSPNEEDEIYQKILDRILTIPQLEGKYKCDRALRNAYKFGDVLGIHQDLGFTLTALLFGNNEWDINWGSETIFTSNTNHDCEIVKSVIPKPGRLIVFDSMIPHTGRVPSSLYPHYRYSVVFNLNPIK